MKIGKIPDGFFPYRVLKISYLITNDHKVQSTNSVHRIYFKNLSKIEIKWIQVSLLSTIGQLSIEVNSKIYGRQMLKIEPNSLYKSLVIKRNNENTVPIYEQILKCLIKNDKLKAVEIATAFINSELKVSSDFALTTEKALKELQRLRLPIKK